MTKQRKGGRPEIYHREPFVDGEWHFIEHFANKKSWLNGSYPWAEARGLNFEYRSDDLGRQGVYVRFTPIFQDGEAKTSPDDGACPDCVASGQTGPPRRPNLKFCDDHTRARLPNVVGRLKNV